MSRWNTPLEDRFIAKLKDNVETGCWEWTGCRLPSGYGKFGIFNKIEYSHRVAYELFVGKIPNGMSVLHHCDNPCCCNPEHLFIGTAKDNVDDKIKKGRDVKGEDRKDSKLTNQEVLEIRRLCSNGVSQRNLAKMFNVCFQSISLIVNNKRWKHVE